MKQPTLKYWSSIHDWMAEHPKYPSVSLLTSHDQGISCTLRPDGTMELSTSSGGGHGDPRLDADGMIYDDWINLINEAKAVSEHYWGEDNGKTPCVIDHTPDSHKDRIHASLQTHAAKLFREYIGKAK